MESQAPPHSRNRMNLSQAVALDLLAMVRSGRFKAGDRLPNERDLMDEFDVGRNTLREAVQSLVALGILDVRAGRGTHVRSLDAETVFSSTAVASLLLRDEAVTHLYDLRRLVESEAAARAAEEATTEQLREMEDLLANYRAAAAEHADTYSWDVALHRAIVGACENPLFGTITDAMTGMLAHTRHRTDLVPGAIERGLEEHTRIVSAIQAHDAAAARTAMAAHIESAMWALGEAREMPDDEE